MIPFILSIDAGTTGITVLIINTNGNILDKYYKEFKQYYPNPGWVEHDPNEIWDTTLYLIHKAFKFHESKACLTIGITNQRETTLIWNKITGKPIYNAIVWQCKRTQKNCLELKKSRQNNIIKNKTGLIIDSYFSATKIAWILDNVDNARDKADNNELNFGTVDTWLLWNLTGNSIHATDYTNASRTMIFNINTKEWDQELLDLFNIPIQILPEVLPSAGKFGQTNKSLFNHSIDISAIIGDQQAALYGQNCFNMGQTKCTYGTGCFLLTNTGKKRIDSKAGLLTTIACDSIGNPTYAIEGSIFMGGAIIQWLRDELQIISNAEETDKIAQEIKNTNDVFIVPAFTGLGAPYWNMNARGIITGLTRGSNRSHIIRAALESIGFQVHALIKSILIDLNFNLKTIKVDGGATANNFLMQFQADLLQMNLVRPVSLESTALGAGILAGISKGIWNNTNELKDFNKVNKIFKPRMDIKQRKSLLLSWEDAIKKACYE